MTAARLRKLMLPTFIMCLALGPGRSAAQCVTDAWTLYSATGDVAEVEVSGSVAWIGAVGGVIRIDLASVGSGSPDQVRITDSEGLVSSDVTSLTIDGFGNVYVGTRRDGISVFDAAGNHLANLSSFDGVIRDDKVITMDALGDTSGTYTIVESDSTQRPATGDRIFVASADGFTPAGLFEGGGTKSFVVERTPGGGFRFSAEPGFGNTLDQVRELLVEPGEVWLGTAGNGVWRLDETTVPPSLQQTITAANGLPSTTVKTLVRGPLGAASDALWIGTGAGLVAWDGSTVVAVDSLLGENTLDVARDGNRLWVLSETPALSRDLYILDATDPALDPVRQPRSTCLADTLYVPREIAVDAAGRAVLGTREDSFTILESGSWLCPPPLGPHSPTIADLALAQDGTLYFGTGDKNKSARVNGLGWFDGSTWSSLTPADNPEMLSVNTTEVVVWPDTTVWFGSTVAKDIGGLNHLFPRSGVLEKYHPNVVDPTRVTQGRNIWGLELDADSNLWVVYGQAGGGLSAIEWPSLLVTNFDFTSMFGGTITRLRDAAVDSRGRIWVTTDSDAFAPGQLYIVDHRGTISKQADDINTAFNVANEIADIAPIPFIAIDSSDQVWLAGEKGLVVGQIGADVGGRPNVSWQRVFGSAAQLGGRNPLPYTTGHLDWDENLWLGTESAGLVRVSKDLSTWTWFEQVEGCPLPDQGVTGLYIDDVARKVYVGTAIGGIAVIDLSGVGGQGGGRLDPRVFPNPWRPASDGILNLSGIPGDERTTLRFYTVSGELVFEAKDVRGAKTWDGRNLGDQLIESGIYLLSAVSANGNVYEGKVAVIR